MTGIARCRWLYVWLLVCAVGMAAAAEPAATGEEAGEPQVIVVTADRIRTPVEGSPLSGAAQQPYNGTIVPGPSGNVDYGMSGLSLPPAYAGGQVASGSNLGTLGNRSIMDAPFNVTSYTSKYMEDIQAKTVRDVLATDPTVRFQYPKGSMMDAMYIRGMTYNVNNASLNGMMGMAPSFVMPTEMLERVEVIRGPGALLTGINVGSEPNGGVNVVLKRALPQDLTRVTTDYASGGQVGTHVDISRRFGSLKQFGMRLNGAVRDGRTTMKRQDSERYLGSVALDYTTDRVRWDLNAYQIKDKISGAGDMVIRAQNFNLANIILPKAPKYKNGIDGLWANVESKGILSQAEVKVTDFLTAYAGVGYSEVEGYGFFGADFITTNAVAGLGTVSAVYQNQKLEKTAYKAGLRSEFYTGWLKHNMILDWSRLDMDQYNGNSAVSFTNVNLYNPVIDTSRLPRVKPNAPKIAEHALDGVTLADTLDFCDGLFQLTGGVRRQSVRLDQFAASGLRTAHYKKAKVSPMFGVVIQPLADRESLAFYFNYIEGLQRGQIVNAPYLNAGETFAPYATEQYEFGTKWNLGTFTNTLSFFQIERPSYIAVPVTGGNILSRDGKQRNQGVEWMIFGEIAESVRLIGGVSYVKTELVSTAGGANEGNEAGGYPRWQGNIGAEWDTWFNRDLTLSARANFNGRMYANNVNTQKVAGWATLDVGVRYKLDVCQRPLTIRVNVDNVLNKQNFYAGARAAGAFYTMPGRTLKCSISMDF